MTRDEAVEAFIMGTLKARDWEAIEALTSNIEEILRGYNAATVLNVGFIMMAIALAAFEDAEPPESLAAYAMDDLAMGAFADYYKAANAQKPREEDTMTKDTEIPAADADLPPVLQNEEGQFLIVARCRGCNKPSYANAQIEGDQIVMMSNSWPCDGVCPEEGIKNFPRCGEREPVGLLGIAADQTGKAGGTS